MTPLTLTPAEPNLNQEKKKKKEKDKRMRWVEGEG